MSPTPIPKFLTREAAAAFLTAQGIETTAQALADLAYRRKGPKFARVNGRTVYTADWLIAWIKAEMALSVQRGRRSAGRQQQHAT
jgi:hypothetical protein